LGFKVLRPRSRFLVVFGLVLFVVVIWLAKPRQGSGNFLRAGFLTPVGGSEVLTFAGCVRYCLFPSNLSKFRTTPS